MHHSGYFLNFWHYHPYILSDIFFTLVPLVFLTVSISASLWSALPTYILCLYSHEPHPLLPRTRTLEPRLSMKRVHVHVLKMASKK